MPTIVYFQIPSNDIERSKKFYVTTFALNVMESCDGVHVALANVIVAEELLNTMP
jgi:predicted enzyme related to lactoylglutathione lyase